RRLDREKLKSVLKTLVVQYGESDEGKYDYGFNSMRFIRLYETRVDLEISQVLDDLESQWSGGFENFSLPETRLLKISRKSKRELQLMVTGWSLNWHFFRHIDHVHRALNPNYGSLTRATLYDPNTLLQPENQARVNLPTLRELIRVAIPPAHVLPSFSSFSRSPLDHSLDIKVAKELKDFLSGLSSSARNTLEGLYIKNLHDS
ncbi:3583_t:CDS:1, partial [Acaulospora colombiana]